MDLGRVQLAEGDRSDALRSLQDARSVLRLIGDRGAQGRRALRAGIVGASAGGRRRSGRRAVAVRLGGGDSSLVGSGTLLDSDRLSFAEQDLLLFEEWVSGWLDRKDLPPEQAALAALAVAERGKARALLDLMRERKAGLAPGADLVRGGRDQVEWVQRDASSALVYLVGRDTLTLWIIPASGAISVRRLPVGRAEVAEAVRSYRVTLGVERGCDETDVQAADAEAPNRLASLLLDDTTRARLAGSQSVIIVPHGPLNLVPFAALPEPDGTSLGSKLAIRYAPSLAILREASTRPAAVGQGGVSIRWETLRPALIVGNPRMPLLTICGVQLRPRSLAGAEESSRWLAREVGAAALVGEEATERRVRADAGGSRLIHLETHGFAYENEAGARATFVALSSDSGATEPPPEGDGMLTVGEVLDGLPRLHAELVVLGACQTGLGDLKDAEGTVGLQRAFLAKRARSTLVSLWTVDDRASAALRQSSTSSGWAAGSARARRCVGRRQRCGAPRGSSTRGSGRPSYSRERTEPLPPSMPPTPLSPARLEQEPRPPLGLVDPDLQQTGARDVPRLVTDVVRLPPSAPPAPGCLPSAPPACPAAPRIRRRYPSPAATGRPPRWSGSASWPSFRTRSASGSVMAKIWSACSSSSR